jgi:hypothetical protein
MDSQLKPIKKFTDSIGCWFNRLDKGKKKLLVLVVGILLSGFWIVVMVKSLVWK